MEGPTPVSALIHAATMVIAGVYLVARAYPIFVASEHALLVVAIVGMITSLGASTIALVSTDLKRILAYSTISHLGLMMPQSNPPRLQVMDQTYTWKEGEADLFDDNIEHEVCNESRVVLIVDILMPMSRLKHWLNRYIVNRYIQPNYANQVLYSMKEDSRKHTAAG